MTAVLAADLTGLIGLRSSVPALSRHLRSPQDWFATAGADRVLATVAGAGLWCTAAVLGLGLVCTAAARLPGAVGRSAGWAGSVLLPQTVQRLLAGSAGLGVLLAPVAAGAAPHQYPATRASAPTATATARTATAGPVPAPAWPLDPPQQPALPAPQWPAVAKHRAAGQRPVTVHTGDSLWLIATRRLAAAGRPAAPAEVSDAWRRWYAANHELIGADPALIHPGQVLQAPTARQEDPA